MLSYRHGFHAGNPADVFKHTVLVALVRAMQQKQKGIVFLDTHAGPALYDLSRPEALKNREFDKGIGRIWNLPAYACENGRDNGRDDAVGEYLALVRACNRQGPLHQYPGSPMLLRARLRRQDRLVLCELHPAEQKALVARFDGDRQVTLVAGDGYRALAAQLPPASGRGLVLIDPSFELRSEIDDITSPFPRHSAWGA
ncbi:MAG: 23S rRNA (adenine(2030)-N(6))-methyltransferase RlmJ [Xanthomonadaceae bacterium]|nr:23S rRNA (adenine(2030)-N(6))-methyltransferase RlmJ [Xanthomonadaceae bacterium]